MPNDPETPFTFGADPEPETPSRRPGWLWKLAVVLALCAGAGTYLYLNPSHIRQYLQGTALELPPAVTRAYKWRDPAGQWQLTGEPPPAGIPFEEITVTGNTNVMPIAPRK